MCHLVVVVMVVIIAGVILVFETPAKSQNARQKNDRAERDETGVERWQAICLAEVDQSVQDCDNVVDTKHEGIQNARRDELQSQVQLVELCESQD